MNFFVTGTDTDVGKTYVTAMLTRSLRRAGFDTVAVKPICCGPRDDVEILCDASGNELTPNETNPVWLSTPAAPLLAAQLENRPVDFVGLGAWYESIRASRQSLLVEGAGGWLVPVTADKTVADLAVAFALPVLVVVANRLGCLNHTLLTVESIRSRGLVCGGLVLNTLTEDQSVVTETNRRILQQTCDVPILFEVGPGQAEIELQVA